MLKYLLLIPAAYLIGFLAFLAILPVTPTTIAKADGIVALTGGGARLDAAVALLESHKAERLLITGVHPSVTRDELKALAHGGARFDCCADLGYAAMSTHGNATEAASWVRENNYKSLIVVTARYHMPRSMTELAASLHSIELHPYPVEPEDFSVSQWWKKPRIFIFLQGEYFKFLVAAVATRLNSLQEHDEPVSLRGSLS